MSELEPTDAPSAVEPAPQPAPPFAAPSDPPPTWDPAPPSAFDPAAQAAASAPARKVGRRKLLWIVTAVVAAAALITAGVVALLPGRTGDSIVAKVQCKPTTLVTCLIKPPAGAEQLPSTDTDTWPRQVSPTAALYTAKVTGDAGGMKNYTAALLDADGMQTIAHTDWNAVDGDNVDIVLLRFSTQKGARAWNATRAAEVVAAYPGQSIAVPGDSTATAHAAVKPDAQGNVAAAYSTVVGDLVLNVAYWSPKQLNAQDLADWAGTELASLRTAPAAHADPADVAPGAEQVACGGGRLTSCLAPMPSGSEQWQSPTDDRWVGAATLTTGQLVKLFWDKPAQQSAVTANLASDGVTGIAHRDWATEGAYKQADIYLIQTVTAAGAQALGESNFGEPVWGDHLSGISHRISKEFGVQAWRTNKQDSNGFIDFYFVATIGNVIVSGWLFFYGSFDAATADDWPGPR